MVVAMLLCHAHSPVKCILLSIGTMTPFSPVTSVLCIAIQSSYSRTALSAENLRLHKAKHCLQITVDGMICINRLCLNFGIL